MRQRPFEAQTKAAKPNQNMMNPEILIQRDLSNTAVTISGMNPLTTMDRPSAADAHVLFLPAFPKALRTKRIKLSFNISRT